ncbi:hypothetical protein J3R82DRAFT_3668 [Butyriboletus roseoflavus]|nr:hypothetical protein J3R82DRAFT_3668 [Butyriboletus roseoflavus]
MCHVTTAVVSPTCLQPSDVDQVLVVSFVPRQALSPRPLIDMRDASYFHSSTSPSVDGDRSDTSTFGMVQPEIWIYSVRVTALLVQVTSFKNFQQSIECQAAKITEVKTDATGKIAHRHIQLELLAGVQGELAAVKTAAVPVNASSASQATKEVRKARILASVAQRIEDADSVKGRVFPCCRSSETWSLADVKSSFGNRKFVCTAALPLVVARSSACATAFQDMPVDTTSSGRHQLQF